MSTCFVRWDEDRVSDIEAILRMVAFAGIGGRGWVPVVDRN